MRERERRVARMRLDREMRLFRKAGQEKSTTEGLLRAVRRALAVPTKEIGQKMGVRPSAVFEFENRELRAGITLASLGRFAGAMGCKVVYGIVPADGRTLEELAEERMWAKELGVGR